MLAEVEPMGGWAVGERMRSPVGAEPLSVVEVAGQRLVELKVGHGLRIGRVEARRLVEQEIALRRPAGGREGRRPVGEALTPRNIRCAGAPVRGAEEWRRGQAGR
jgi:hypothetical protein